MTLSWSSDPRRVCSEPSPTCSGPGGSFRKQPGQVQASADVLQRIEHIAGRFLSKPCLLPIFQVPKKEKPELIKTVTITPSESTHFRVILSSEAMQSESDTGKEDNVSLPAIVKPEPRTPVTTVTPVNQEHVSTVVAISPITSTEPVDVLTSTVTTSTPATSQVTDSPSKKKGAVLTLLSLQEKTCLNQNCLITVKKPCI